MHQISLQALKDALAREPRAAALACLEPDDLRRRLEGIGARRIHLRPASQTAHRIADLIVNLPHLRPEPRSILFNHLFQLLDFSEESKEDVSSCETGVILDSAPAAADPPLGEQPPAAAAAAQTEALSDRFLPRPPDLFDRLLDWVAALMG